MTQRKVDPDFPNTGTQDEQHQEINHFEQIVLSGAAPKLAGNGKVLYEVALHNEEKQLYFRITGQEGGAGLHSKEWLSVTAMLELIEAQKDKPWKSSLYKQIFSGGSANNHSFCSVIIRDLGLASKTDSSRYLHVLSTDFEEKKSALLALAKSQAISKKK
ncbi:MULTISPECIES: hypothetical protein [Vibrio]|uniref:hypothetical protein n=1 Tax=Vibrio TaxID=662 RepID=UPI001AF9977C|nr:MULTISPECIES: hypothetical protein [Vibrio]MCR9764617.1 hypothetical protein [Vibrio parahaemolyticus]CAD7814976.1 hypothetical protein ACOMICROBIO_LMKGKHOH_00151 [Vibrio sp. B1FIG11]CAE6923840.1 hypothetical protein ACOMICROBIO_LMKGKHOH_00151 [Vibrio sp. B1FIG11]